MSRREVAVGAGVTLAVLASLGLLAAPWFDAAPPGEQTQVGTRTVASLLALALVVSAALPALRGSSRLGNWLLVLAAGASLFSWFNFGSCYHGRFVNQHEMFHYFLGSKYFPELGYDGLYLASLSAQRETTGRTPTQPRVRDLHTNHLVPTASTVEAQAEVVQRFEPERWKAFVADHRAFAERTSDRFIRRLRIDHGYNPTPAWTFVARLLSTNLSSASSDLAFLAALDVVLLALMFAAIFRVYGLRAGCLCMAVFGLGYGWRFYYIGGAFLRADWLAAVGLGLCALQRGRAAAAGALFGYAAAMRGFPALLLLGPGVLAVRAILQGGRPRWPFELAAGFAVVLALAVGAGTLAGRGPGAWLEFAGNIEGHRELAPPNRVGLESALRNAPAFLEARSQGLDEIPVWTQRGVAQVRADQRIARWTTAALFLALLLAALWGTASVAGAAVLSTAALFALVPMGSYYWVLLFAAPLQGGLPVAAALMSLSTAMKGVHLLYEGETTRYAIKSLGLAVFFVGWLLPGSIRGARMLRGHDASREAK